MDTLYVGDIPQEYHYAQFNSNYIDLYNTNYIGSNTNYDYYRIYMYDNQFMYEQRNGTTSNFNSITIQNSINVTDNPMYRRDMPNVITITFIFALVGIWLLNIISSVINKGGVLGGLL